MADIVDLAGENDFVSEVLQRHKNSTKEKAARGICLNCETVLAPDLIYCDLDCKADHEYMKRVRANQGIK
jgi:hypothetical protein